MKRMTASPPSRAARKIIALCREAGIQCPNWIRIVRTRAGRHQRSAGAWSWYALDADYREVVGSIYPIRELHPGKVKMCVVKGELTPELVQG